MESVTFLNPLKNESKADYIARCLASNPLGELYPHRGERRKLAGKYFDSLYKWQKNQKINPETLRTNDAAKYLGVTKRILYYYEEIGWIKPKRDRNKWRYYDKSSLDVLKELMERRNVLRAESKTNSDPLD
jgi:hypothetical protein